MKEEINQPFPGAYHQIAKATKELGFTMASDIMTCSLLRTLAASKTGMFLELGTGTGLATAWILDGMNKQSTLISVDNDEKLLDVARKYLGSDQRLQLECMDGEAWMKINSTSQYDFIFADTWHGKYLLLNEVLNMLKPGGVYVIDDMLPQANWPEGHAEKANNLLQYLDSRKDLTLTRMVWSSGIVIASKR
jgi:predicted O-methyltransferase YrrM